MRHYVAPYYPPPAPTKLIDQAVRIKNVAEVEIDWDDELLEDDLADLIADAIQDVAEITGRWVDEGIGPYEYGSISSVHHDWCIEIDEESHAVVAIPGAPADLALPELQTTESGGGCDGEHYGRCRRCCESWSIEVKWTPGHHEVRDGTLFAVYFAEAA